MNPSPLPSAVNDLARRLGARPSASAAPATVSLTQTGRMKRRLGVDAWMTFTARQTIATCGLRFDWRARFGPFGLVTARDALTSAGARFDIRALGVFTIARAPQTEGLMRGERMRYLAELPWAPDAILANPALTWRVLDDTTLTVSAGVGDGAAEVLLGLDGEGHVVSAYAPDRPRSVGAGFVPTPWRGRFWDYREHQGRWLPFAGEVAWEIDGRSEVYWQGALERWAILPPGL